MDLAAVCRILAAQVAGLDGMFNDARQLASQAKEALPAVAEESREAATSAYERMSRLALRAQTQTARTAAVLGRLLQLPGMEDANKNEEAPKAPTPPTDFHITIKDKHGPYNRIDTIPEDQMPTRTMMIRTPLDSALAEFLEMIAASPCLAGTINEKINEECRWQPGGIGFAGMIPTKEGAAA
jgi:hypothetical protein